MKFDDHLAAYLYEYKSLTLEGIGNFTLDIKAQVPGEQEKGIYYPIEGLEFTYNPRSRTDEKLIIFLVKRLGKIEPLIRSDVEYYLSHIKQFLNIGNPYTIEGIGTLHKTNYGTFEFTPGSFLPAKEHLTPQREHANHNYPVKSKSSAGRVFIIIILAAFALSVLGGIGWGIFYFIKHQPTGTNVTQAKESIDTIAKENDTAIKKNATRTVNENLTKPLQERVATNKTDTATGNLVSYKMIFEITKSGERAHTRTTQLNNLHSYTQYDSIPVNDSVAYYRLFLVMKIHAADTTHVKDSLKTFFGKSIYAEVN